MIYFDCKMGVAGDMLMAAFYDLMNPDQKTAYLEKLNSLFPHHISVKPKALERNHIFGTYMEVFINGQEEGRDYEHHSHEHHSHEHHDHEHLSHEGHSHDEHHHHHYSYQDVLNEIDRFDLPESVKNDARQIYEIIGRAEAKVHQTTLTDIHFHEVGSLDAIADVVGSALAIDMLKPDSIKASKIHVGNGKVKCAHGILDVPAPATKEILDSHNVPYYKGAIMTELCTPTGAAILSYYVNDFEDKLPDSNCETGIGFGKKELEEPNQLRILYQHN